MSIASEPKPCPKCGEPISAEAPQGLCPKCLLLQASVATEAGPSGSPKSAPPTHEHLALAFPQLEILELIGQGGMGFVYKARQPKLGRLVALKILPQSSAADPAFAERFTREGQVLARLNHPNIVTIHDFGQANGFFYLLMEFVDGVNLRQAMQVGRFTPAQALAVVPKICEALQFAHNEGILHRDIKPENILLDSKGRVKIADFGIAKLVLTGTEVILSRPGQAEGQGRGPVPLEKTPRQIALTETGAALGTPHYMAPEQREHPQDVDQRADIFSLGVVFYEMLTGELPIGRFAPPSQKSTVDPRVDEVVLRSLEKERERRQSSAGEVKTQVETIASTREPGKGLLRPAVMSPAPRFSRAALVGACWVPLFFAASAFLMFETRHTPFPYGYNSIAALLIFVSLAGIFGTTVLGWIAVAQIRRPASGLYGLGLAVFDGLLYPLLALDVLLGGICWYVVRALSTQRIYQARAGESLPPEWQQFWWQGLVAVMVILVIDFLIISLAWRSVNQAPAPPAQKPDRFWRWLALVVLAAVVPMGLAVAVILGTFIRPNFTGPGERARDLQEVPLPPGYHSREILPPPGYASSSSPAGKLVIGAEQYSVTHPEPGQMDWGFKLFVPANYLASVLFVCWSNGVPRVDPGLSAYFKVGRAGGIDVPFCSLSCYPVPRSQLGSMTNGEGRSLVAEWGFPESRSTGVTNAVQWNVNLGLGFTSSRWVALPPYRRLEPRFSQSVQVDHQWAIRLVEFNAPEAEGTPGWSGIELRILLQPLRSPPIRTAPTEIERTNYIGGTGLASTMAETLESIKTLPLEPP